MSLTVFDVTVRSIAIIMLSMIAFWFASQGRTKAQLKPIMVRVDNRRPDLYQQATKDKSLRTAGILGATSLAIGICIAVIISILAAFVFSTLTSSIGG